MTKSWLLISMFFIIMLPALSQQGAEFRALPTATSHFGNYIYLVDKNDLDDSANYAALNYFIIKRATINAALDSSYSNTLEKELKVVGEARTPKNARELRGVLSDDGIKAFKEAFKLKTDDEIISFIKLHPNPKDYIFFYSQIETRIALRHVFLDKDVKEGVAYLYYIYSVDKQNNQKLWGRAVALGKAGNYMLPYFKAISLKPIVKDSSVSLEWKVPININLDNIPKPSKRLAFDNEGNLYNSFFAPHSIRAVVNVYEDDKWQKQPGLLFPQTNNTGDTLDFRFFKKAKLGSAISASITLEDEIYNEGRQSDTINAFIVTEKNAPRIYYLKVKDTLNGIALSWHPVTTSPYLAGIQIIRYGLDKQIDTLPLLPIEDTFFWDNGVRAGVNYRYEVRVLYLPGIATYQTVPASGFGVVTKFSRPSPPNNLSATNEGKHIRLNWEAANDPTIAAYFVYRGLKPNKLSSITGMIKEKTYLDTTMELKGGSQYYYAVLSQNLMQDTSIYSNVVQAMPNRKLTVNPPTEMTFYYTNGILNVLWKDIRLMDNQIESYIVQKRKKSEEGFTYLTQQPTIITTLQDSLIEAGITYQYRVASLSFRGDTSQFSEIFEYTLPKKRVDVLNDFTLLNTTKGITISLPTVLIGDRKAYNIFRRKVSEENFSKIATVPADQFLYEDTKVAKGETYFYAVSITETDGREGKMGMSVSIRKN